MQLLRPTHHSLHWVLDVVMDEDQARNRKDHGPQNLALLRKLALNAKLEPSKGSMRGKLKQAGWDNTFLSQSCSSSQMFKCDSPASSPSLTPAPGISGSTWVMRD